jgi:hypothetical protein
MTAVGIVLIVIGVLFLLLGLARAAKDVFFAGRASAQSEGGRAGPGGTFDPERWAKLVGALTEFIRTSPMWFALVIVGAVLVAVGAAML